MINFFVHAIEYSFALYINNLKYIILVLLFFWLVNKIFKTKIKIFSWNLFLIYLLNVFVISLWKWPNSYICLSLSTYYRPLFSNMHFIPGNFIADVINTYHNTHDLYYSSKFIGFLLLNIIYFIPLGIIIKVLVPKINVFGIVVISALLSLFIEYMQISGIFNLFNCTWRFFDIDDIIANTLGAILGLIIYKWGVKRWKRK